MSCCGEKRAQLSKKPNRSRVLDQKERAISGSPEAQDTPAYFQYVGQKTLTVLGRETRKIYRFDKPGVVAAVDRRDQRALEAVPTLRLLKKSTP